MNLAIGQAQVDKNSVKYVNAHGTSTPYNDKSETTALKNVFGDHAKNGLMVSSTKSMTGHLLGAAGSVEAIVTALALRDGVAPPTINLDQPGEGCDLDFVPHHARDLDTSYALCNSFGFGGTNATLALKKVS